MAFELDGVAVDLVLPERQLEQVIGRHQAGDDRRGARAQPASDRDVLAKLEADAVGRVKALEGPHDEVLPALGQRGTADVDRELLCLADLELEVHLKRRGEDVEAWPQVRRGGGCGHQTPAKRHLPEGLIST
jgi:hypothetical protein